jgi:hypothetical protein
LGISHEEFYELFSTIERTAIHLETRDSYGTEVELPHLAKWEKGEPDDDDWLQSWLSLVQQSIQAGRSWRRAQVVSEPLSDYQRWAHHVTDTMVTSGEDIRWAPRRLVSSIAFPGNDFWLFDDRLIVFLHFSGNGLIVDRQVSTDPADVELCRSAFKAAWTLAIPHRDYKPA